MPQSGRVVEGYAILQPRIASSLPLGYEGSRYQRLVSGAGGIDPYASAVSDVYQDLCGEGSYVGKGIYDVDAFEAALAGRVAENYAAEPRPVRRHLRARRDSPRTSNSWTSIPRATPLPRRVRTGGRAATGSCCRGFSAAVPSTSSAVAASIPLLGRWKMFDNLRRTLVAPASVLSLVIAWTLPLPSAALWTAFVVAMLAIPNLPSLLAGLIPRHQPHLLAEPFPRCRWPTRSSPRPGPR